MSAARPSHAFVAALALVVLHGRIVDKTTGQPLVHVVVDVGGRTATTDGDGRYRLSGLRAGAATLTLQSDDVPVERVRLVLKAGINARDVRACSTTLDYGCGEAPTSSAGAG